MFQVVALVGFASAEIASGQTFRDVGQKFPANTLTIAKTTVNRRKRHVYWRWQTSYATPGYVRMKLCDRPREEAVKKLG